MIKEANISNKTEIYELWKSAFPTRSRNYLNFYFKHVFDEGKCIYLQQDGKIISSLQINDHILMFQGRKLEVSYFLGVATLPDYRRRGHMRYLMNMALDEVSHNHLITLIEAFNPKLYEQFGFETLYYSKTYAINAHYFDKVNAKGVSHNLTAMDLYQLYQSYAKHFDGYYVRDLHYYEILLKRAVLDHGNICVYRNKSHEITGYAIYSESSVEVKVQEIVYLESIALMKMLRYICEGYPDVSVTVSQSEKLEKLFPLTIPKKSAVTMVRINNYELFNKLFNTKVHSAKEAYAILKKPIYNNEIY